MYYNENIVQYKIIEHECRCVYEQQIARKNNKQVKYINCIYKFDDAYVDCARVGDDVLIDVSMLIGLSVVGIAGVSSGCSNGEEEVDDSDMIGAMVDLNAGDSDILIEFVRERLIVSLCDSAIFLAIKRISLLSLVEPIYTRVRIQRRRRTVSILEHCLCQLNNLNWIE
jgi:hypothetical protein